MVPGDPHDLEPQGHRQGSGRVLCPLPLLLACLPAARLCFIYFKLRRNTRIIKFTILTSCMCTV